MTITAKSKAEAADIFSRNGVVAYNTFFSSATLNAIRESKDPHQGIGLSVRDSIRDALPKYLNAITKRKAGLKVKVEDAQSAGQIVTVVIPTGPATVLGESIDPGICIYISGEIAASVEVDTDDHVLVYDFVVDKPVEFNFDPYATEAQYVAEVELDTYTLDAEQLAGTNATVVADDEPEEDEEESDEGTEDDDE